MMLYLIHTYNCVNYCRSWSHNYSGSKNLSEAFGFLAQRASVLFTIDYVLESEEERVPKLEKNNIRYPCFVGF